ncbi:HNH endonuclease domain-containing protein [Bacillus thuringiensis]|uniref:HNH endonuclease domain-containing protein n=1 Tax=Bacillus thuringiensis TaxID=1428 RepID=UPI000BFCCB34|nr:HNH endonuclease domain-containing protein [Bacillus thuringiensis]PGQ44412.1 HNH endonuclease [Bacillus thuringiensis]
MRKIQLSKKVEDLHEQYFRDRILPKLGQSYRHTPEEISELKGKMNLILSDLEIQQKLFNEHQWLIRYIRKAYKTFAKGNLTNLKRLDQSIQLNCPYIYELIRLEKGKNYSAHLNEIFGYKQFKVKEFFYYIKKKALQNLGLKRYSSRVQEEIVNILSANFPKQKKEIEDYLDPRNLGELHVDTCAKQFKKLKQLNITMDNFKEVDIFQEEWNDYHFVMESGIRVCPYCNRQYITPILSDNGKMRSDIDHFLPKCYYPYFSMSLYNLVPVCKSCNQSLKGDRNFTFTNISPYEEHIGDYFKFKADELTYEISMEVPNDLEAVIQHLDIFKIEALYNYHQNQVEELVKKRIAYPDDYIHDLYKKNKEYFNSELEIKQILVGYIGDVNRMNDEAFLKFRRDLAEQLGFIGGCSQERIEGLKKLIRGT